MPRLPERVVSRTQPPSVAGNRLGADEVSSATVTEARSVAAQAVEALEDGAALSQLASRLRGESVPAPLSSLADLPEGNRWLQGELSLSASSPAAEVKVLQRALMKVGAHHVQGRHEAALLLLPWGADGSLGQGTLKALDVALGLAGRTDLLPSAQHLPLGREVAAALEGLLKATPVIQLPPQQEVFSTGPSGSSTAEAVTSGGPVPQRLNLLGGVAVPVGHNAYSDKWSQALSRMAAERSRYHAGAAGLSPQAKTWLQGLEAVRGTSESEQLAAVNRLVNEVPYEVDGSGDAWKTPLEFFAQRGDCEDYALAKYASLKLLGFDESRMRMLVVRDTFSGQAHAVLAVDMADGTYILDNQSQLLLRHQQLQFRDGSWAYLPMAGLSRTTQWIFGRPTG
jgi:predicted transglutaminase-like cysteine proteinase